MIRRLSISVSSGQPREEKVSSEKEFRRAVERADKRADIAVDGGTKQPRVYWLQAKNMPSFNGSSPPAAPAVVEPLAVAAPHREAAPAPPPVSTNIAASSGTLSRALAGTERDLELVRAELQAEREQRSKSVGDISIRAHELSSELQRLLEELSRLDGAVGKVPAQIQAAHESLREQLAQLLVHELPRLNAAVHSLQTSLSERPARDELGLLVASAVAPAEAKLERALKDLHEERELLEEEGQQQRRRIRTYLPGAVEELKQHLAERSTQLEDLRKELREAHVQIDGLQRDKAHLQHSSGALDRDEVERQLEKLAAERRALEEHKQLQVQCDQLRDQVAAYAKLEATYRAAQDVRARDQQLAEHAQQLEEQVGQLDRERQRLSDEARRANHHLQEQRQDVFKLRQDNEALTAEVERLKAELQRHRDQVAALSTAAQEHAAEKLALAEEREEAVRWRRAQEEALQRRSRELDEQVRASLEAQDAAHESRMEVLEEAYQRKTAANDEQQRLSHEQRYEAQLADLRRQIASLTTERDRYHEATARLQAELDGNSREQTRWEAERHARELELQRHHNTLEALAAKHTQHQQELAQANDRLAEQERLHHDKLAQRRSEADKVNERLAGLNAQAAEAHGRLTTVDQQYRDELALVAKLHEERRRLEEPTSREVRAKLIETPWFDPSEDKKRRSAQNAQDELKWLDDLDSRIRKAEFIFSRRLLEAFHTSLKITHWSPLTVLAGVSGTGKSALARLYAHFGGLRFLLAPVQPNWDSPQDLFGFFNHMDGRYKATPLLRALAQSQKDPGHGGFDDGLLLVALDEMNLARVEYYGSELLSRWEARRDGTEPEALQIDLGHGDPYKIQLGTNVLWVGTMNEDETTMSLSDKVLERGNVITFPRPHDLKRRQRSGIAEGRSWLSAQTFRSWMCEPDTLLEQTRRRLKEVLEGMNHQLGLVNRAISHRTLQAIEHYVANHPRVRVDSKSDEPWQRAFAEQLVQKVIPKLRGLPTHSPNGKKCLDGFEELLKDSAAELVADFANARESAQFMWTSARYLELAVDAK